MTTGAEDQRDQGTSQDNLLGPHRATLWREGKLTLKDMTDQSNRPLSLQQLHDMVSKNEQLPAKTYEPKAGLSVLEQKVMEEAMAAGIATNQEATTYLNAQTGERITTTTAPTADEMAEISKWPKVTVIQNTLGAGEVWDVQELKHLAGLALEKASLVGPTGKVITISPKSGQVFTAQDAVAITQGFDALKNVKTIPQTQQKFAKAVAENGTLKVTMTPAGTITPCPRPSLQVDLPDLVSAPAPFVDHAAIAAKQAEQAAAQAKAEAEAKAAKESALEAAGEEGPGGSCRPIGASIKNWPTRLPRPRPQPNSRPPRRPEAKLHADAHAKIGEILANPAGQTLKAQAIGKLMQSEPDLKPADLLAKAHEQAAQAQQKASDAAAVSGAKKKLLAGLQPTPAQWKALNKMPVEAQNAFLGRDRGSEGRPGHQGSPGRSRRRPAGQNAHHGPGTGGIQSCGSHEGTREHDGEDRI